ncbi:MAG: hypothetical protein V4488_19310 [Pseudomonadota bacterium]
MLASQEITAKPMISLAVGAALKKTAGTCNSPNIQAGIACNGKIRQNFLPLTTISEFYTFLVDKIVCKHIKPCQALDFIKNSCTAQLLGKLA